MPSPSLWTCPTGAPHPWPQAVVREDIYDMARQTKEKVGPVAILVNNAGIVSGTTVLNTPDTK